MKKDARSAEDKTGEYAQFRFVFGGMSTLVSYSSALGNTLSGLDTADLELLGCCLISDGAVAFAITPDQIGENALHICVCSQAGTRGRRQPRR